MRTLLFKLSLAILVIVVTGTGSLAQEMEPWRKDWQKLAEAIEPYARAGALERKSNESEFNRVFAKEVEWQGTLRGYHSSSVAKSLILEMQPIYLPLSDGSIVEVKEVSISCANQDRGCSGWSKDLIGKVVVFRTKLANRTKGILPVMRLEDKRNDRQTIYIETDGGELVKVVTQ